MKNTQISTIVLNLIWCTLIGHTSFGLALARPQHNTTQHNTTQHNTTQHNTTQHNTTQLGKNYLLGPVQNDTLRAGSLYALRTSPDLAATRATSCCLADILTSIEEQLADIEQEIANCCADINSKLPCNEIVHITQADFDAGYQASGGFYGYVITGTDVSYCLSEDITSTALIGIYIAADNVDLNLNGHVIDMDFTGTIGIYDPGSNNLAVYNGTFQNSFQSPVIGGHELVDPPGGFGIYLVSVINAQIDAITTLTCQGGIQATDSIGVTVTESFFESSLTGLVFDESSDCLALGCSFLDMSLYGVISAGSNITIQDCLCVGCYYGIYFQQISNGSINNCKFFECGGISPGTFTPTGNGVYVTSDSNNILIQNCNVSNSFGNGIYMASASNITLQNCISQGNTDVGILAQVVSGLTIENCTSANNTGTGLTLNSVTNGMITNCTISENNGDGISGIYASNVTIANCLVGRTFVNGSSNGVVLSRSFDSVIENCNIHTSCGNGIWLNDGTERCALLGNVVTDNKLNGIFLDSAYRCQVRDNTLTGNNTALSLTAYGLYGDSSFNAIYHNFANNNGASAADNYSPLVDFVVLPGLGIGSLENISQ